MLFQFRKIHAIRSTSHESSADKHRSGKHPSWTEEDGRVVEFILDWQNHRLALERVHRHTSKVGLFLAIFMELSPNDMIVAVKFVYAGSLLHWFGCLKSRRIIQQSPR